MRSINHWALEISYYVRLQDNSELKFKFSAFERNYHYLPLHPRVLSLLQPVQQSGAGLLNLDWPM
jgi:hypothetical protein